MRREKKVSSSRAFHFSHLRNNFFLAPRFRIVVLEKGLFAEMVGHSAGSVVAGIFIAIGFSAILNLLYDDGRKKEPVGVPMSEFYLYEEDTSYLDDDEDDIPRTLLKKANFRRVRLTR